MKFNIWNFWADKYDKLWVQKYSLKPTRTYILQEIHAIQEKNSSNTLKVLDLGCGSGQLINDLYKSYNNIEVTGIDFSEKMLDISKQKNPLARHIKLDVKELDKLKGMYNIIVCTHSLPYYKEIFKVINELKRLLMDNGKLLIAFASANSIYDKFILSFVKLTTGPASYPSDKKFKEMISSVFIVESLKVIKEKKFMPRIAVYTLKKEII